MSIPPLLRTLHDLLLPSLHRSHDRNILLAPFKDRSTPQIQRHILTVSLSRQTPQFIFSGSVDQSPDIRPVHGSGAHDAGFPGGNQRTLPEEGLREVVGGETRELRFGVPDVRE